MVSSPTNPNPAQRYSALVESLYTHYGGKEVLDSSGKDVLSANLDGKGRADLNSFRQRFYASHHGSSDLAAMCAHLDQIFKPILEKPGVDHNSLEYLVPKYFFQAWSEWRQALKPQPGGPNGTSYKGGDSQKEAMVLDTIERIIKWRDSSPLLLEASLTEDGFSKLISGVPLTKPRVLNLRNLDFSNSSPENLEYFLMEIKRKFPNINEIDFRGAKFNISKYILDLEILYSTGCKLNFDGVKKLRIDCRGLDIEGDKRFRIEDFSNGLVPECNPSGRLNVYGKDLWSAYENPLGGFINCFDLANTVLHPDDLKALIFPQEDAGLYDFLKEEEISGTYIGQILKSDDPINLAKASRVLTSIYEIIDCLRLDLEFRESGEFNMRGHLDGFDRFTREDMMIRLIRSIKDKKDLDNTLKQLDQIAKEDYEHLRDYFQNIFNYIMAPDLLMSLDAKTQAQLTMGDERSAFVNVFLDAVVDGNIKPDEILRLAKLERDFDPLSKLREIGGVVIDKRKVFADNWYPIIDAEVKFIVDHENYSVVNMTKADDFIQESKHLGHCLGKSSFATYTNSALKGNNHFFSIRDSEGKPISTVEFQLLTEDQLTESASFNYARVSGTEFILDLKQHQGAKDQPLSPIAKNVLKEFIGKINNGSIKIDLLQKGMVVKEGSVKIPSKLEFLAGIEALDHKKSDTKKSMPLMQRKAWTIIAAPSDEYFWNDSDNRMEEVATSMSAMTESDDNRLKAPNILRRTKIDDNDKVQDLGWVKNDPAQLFPSVQRPQYLALQSHGKKKAIIPDKYRDSGLDNFLNETGIRQKIKAFIDRKYHLV